MIYVLHGLADLSREVGHFFLCQIQRAVLDAQGLKLLFQKGYPWRQRRNVLVNVAVALLAAQ
jgi:hypothetical protein